MKLLSELIRLLPPEKISQVELISSDIDRESKLGQLYFGIKGGQFSSEEDAYQKIYGSTANHGAFKKLKQRLRDRLLNTLFFVDVNQPKFSDYSSAATNCYQQFAQVKILLGKLARDTAIWLAENLLEYTRKYELNDISYLLTIDLQNHYGWLSSNRSKFNYYNAAHEELKEIIIAESEANELINRIHLERLKILNGKLGKKEWEELQSKLRSTEMKLEKVRSSRFLLYLFLSKVTLSELLKEYEDIVKYCTQAMELFDEKSHNVMPISFVFFRRKRNALFNMGKLNEAISMQEEVESYTRQGSHNWFGTRYDTALLMLHNKNYEAAYKLQSDTFSGKTQQYVSNVIMESWKVLDAYLAFLKTIGKIPGQEDEFRLNKFLNEVPTFQKDKHGRNVAILLVQLLFLLARNDYPKYIDRLDALNQYRQRYLKEPNTFRSNCIMRMMTKVGKYGFHPRRVSGYVQKDFWKLKNTPPEMSNNSADVEIIRYEDMWEIVMEMLEENYRKNH